VTLRVRAGLPSLRSRSFAKAFRRSLRAAAERGDFRVVRYALQRDHVHLLAEASDERALGRGMKAVASRLARAAQRVFRLAGRVLFGRYPLRILRTPREVRNALAYALLNARKHWAQRFGQAPPVRLDEASSGRWFDGWRRDAPRGAPPAPDDAIEVSAPRTWRLSRGWRRHGLVDPAEVPAGARRRSSR